MTFNHSLLGRYAEHCPRNSNEMCVHSFCSETGDVPHKRHSYLHVSFSFRMFTACLMLRIRTFGSRFLVLIWDLDIWYGVLEVQRLREIFWWRCACWWTPKTERGTPSVQVTSFPYEAKRIQSQRPYSNNLMWFSLLPKSPTLSTQPDQVSMFIMPHTED